MTLTIEFTPEWFKFSRDTKTFTVSEGSTSEKRIGIYIIKIKLTDSTTAFSDNSFNVEVMGKIIEEEKVVAAKEVNRPIPKIESINPKRLVTIVWD